MFSGPEVYTQFAMGTLVSQKFGQYYMTASLFLFSFTTLITYFYKMDTNIAFVKETLNIKNSSNFVNHLFRFGLLGMVIFGAVNSAALIWGITDLGVGLLGWVNVITVIFLSKTAVKALKDYDEQRNQGLNPVFRPSKVGIKNADFWEELEAKEITIKTERTKRTERVESL
ncbi:Na+/alanine symporter [Neobacillus sp. B4I6]|uniref:alanine:cation symporter family protein n=1 Tax=Neobacillus sp. B4I6 TaxID=3373925 RepID=UPI003D1A4A5F